MASNQAYLIRNGQAVLRIVRLVKLTFRQSTFNGRTGLLKATWSKCYISRGTLSASPLRSLIVRQLQEASLPNCCTPQGFIIAQSLKCRVSLGSLTVRSWKCCVSSRFIVARPPNCHALRGCTSAVSIKCSMFFCEDSRMRSCQRARFWFDYINTLFEPFCLKCAALNLVPGRDAAAQKHMTGLRVLSIPASAPPWDTQKRDRSTASIDLAYDCIWALFVICCFGSSGWPRSGGPTKIIWHVCVFWVF